MPSDANTVATKANFVPMVVGQTDRDRSIVSSARAHDGASQQPRPEVHETQLNVLLLHLELSASHSDDQVNPEIIVRRH